MVRKKRIWKSSITHIQRDRLTTHGVAQEEIIRTFSYEEMLFLLIAGRKPNKTEATMLRHVILSHCSHGITGQSTLALRMGADTGTSFLHSAIGGFSIGSGPFHQGGLEQAMLEISTAKESGNPEAYVQDKLGRKEIVYGFGHRFHTLDPRAQRLIEECEHHSFIGEHVSCVKLMDKTIAEAKGVRMNIEAAGGAILLDLSFPIEVASLIIIVGRGPMFAAAYMERLKELKANGKFFPRIKVYDEVDREE